MKKLKILTGVLVAMYILSSCSPSIYAGKQYDKTSATKCVHEKNVQLKTFDF